MRGFKWLLCATILSLSSCVSAKPIETNSLFKSQYMSVGGFSPNGEYLSLIANEPDNRYLYVLDVVTAEMTSVGKLGRTGRIDRLEWLTSRRLFLRIENTGGNPEFIIDFKVTENGIKSDIKRISTPGYVVDFLSKNTGQLLYAKQKPHKNAGHELILVDIDPLLQEDLSEAQPVGIPRGKNLHFFYDHSTKRIFTTLYDEDDDAISFSYRTFKNPKWRKFLTITDREDTFTPVGFLNDSTLAVLTNRHTDKVSLHEFDIESQSIGKIIYSHPKYDLTDATLSKIDGQVLAVGYYDHGRFKLEYLSDTKDELAPRVNETFPDTQWYYLARHDEKGLRVIGTYGSDNPGAYYLYSRDKDTAELISEVYPDLSAYTFSKTDVFTVKSDDGEDIEGYLNLPVDGSHDVLLVMPHGGPIGVRESDSFNKEVQFLTNRGYSTLRINFRGSTGFGKKFMESATGEFGKRIEKDIMTVLRHVKDRHNFKHVCAIGASYGGYSSSMLAIDFPQQIDCVVASFGIYDLPLMFNESNLKTQENYLKSVERVVGENNEALFDRSPVYLAKELKQPILLIAGYEDQIAPIEHSFRMKYVLEMQSNEPETIFYRKTGHGHRNWWGDRHEYAAIDDFLQRTLNLTSLWSGSDDDKEVASILADDAIRLADSYNFKDKVDNDFSKAFHFYEKAADFNHPRATYNIGAFYYDGHDSVTQDFLKAKAYFEKAGSLGYSRAYFMLAQMFANGEGVEESHIEAVSFYEKSIKAGHDAEAFTALAEYHCLGTWIEQNVETCAKYLSFESFKDHEELKDRKITERAKSLRKEVLSTIISSTEVSPEKRQPLIKMLEREFDVLPHDIGIDVSDYGLWNNGEVSESGSDFKAIAGQTVGVTFDIESTGFITDKYMKNALVIEWVKEGPDQEMSVLHRNFLWGYTQGWNVRYTAEDEVSAGDSVTLFVYDTKGRIVLEQEFTFKS